MSHHSLETCKTACRPHQDSLDTEKLNKVLHLEEGNMVVICAKVNSFVPLTYIKILIAADENTPTISNRTRIALITSFTRNTVLILTDSVKKILYRRQQTPVQLLKAFLELGDTQCTWKTNSIKTFFPTKMQSYLGFINIFTTTHRLSKLS